MGTVFGIFFVATIILPCLWGLAGEKCKKEGLNIPWGKLFLGCLVGTIISGMVQTVLLDNEDKAKRIQIEAGKQQAQQVQTSTPVITPVVEQKPVSVPVVQSKQPSSVIPEGARVSAADLMAEPHKYFKKEVVVGPLMIWNNRINESVFWAYSYNPKTKSPIGSQEAYIFYAKMSNKIELRNLDTTNRPLVYIRGDMDHSEDVGGKIIPVIVAKEIVFVK